MKRSNPTRLAFSDHPTREEVGLIRKGLEDYNQVQTNGEIDNPGIEINLVLKDVEGNVAGGIIASTMIRVMHLDIPWIAEEFRNSGYGRELVLAAESIGNEKGCLASQTWSFSFQAPGFYQKLGYEVLGIYDGYPNGITEYVLKKRLQSGKSPRIETGGRRGERSPNRLLIMENGTEEDEKTVHGGLSSYVREHLGEDVNNPGIRINWVMKDPEGKVMGGLLGRMAIRNLVIENLWFEVGCRGKGYGKNLMMAAENIAKENGCIASQICCLSFQAPGFFQKLGYEAFGISDGYPDPIREFYFIKKYV